MSRQANTISKVIGQAHRRTILWFIGVVALCFVILAALFYGVLVLMLAAPTTVWLTGFGLAAAILIFMALLTVILISYGGRHESQQLGQAVGRELRQLRAANNRAKALQAMASTLRATLSFEPVVESALDVCGLALEESGVPNRALSSAVYLYEGAQLRPVATRRLARVDTIQVLPGVNGIVGKALTQAETTITYEPASDPELGRVNAFHQCETVVCVPLRAGFQIFGAMVLGAKTKFNPNREHVELFNSVADQAVIALQNAQLYQNLEAEKQRIIETEEEARKELARDLHDGPTQSVAAIVMRVNFVRSLVLKQPRQALAELRKIEELAKQTSKEIRGMLFTLRPLVLDTDGLGAAIEKVMSRKSEDSGIEMRIVGSEYGDLLSERAQGVVFYIVEEALGNASKHSQAKLIEVRMWREDDLFVTVIQDDGVGFDVKAVNENYSSRGSLGMVNMRERADLIGGSVKVDSQAGKGTTITLIVPIEKSSQRQKQEEEQVQPADASG